jgi:hypothetical protein
MNQAQRSLCPALVLSCIVIDDLLCSVRPQMQQHNLSCEALGNFETLRERLDAELVALKLPGGCIGLVGAWSRVPANSAPR